MQLGHICFLLQTIGTGALLIVNNYVLGLIWAIDSICLFHLHRKDKNGNLSSSGKADLLQFDILLSWEDYILSVYYNAYLLTLYFRMQFIKVHCIVNDRSAIKCSLKKLRLSVKWPRDLNTKKKYHCNLENKKQAVKKRYARHLSKYFY